MSLKAQKSKVGNFNVGYFWDEVWRFNVHLIWPAGKKELERYVKRAFGADYETGDDFSAKCVEMSDSDGVGGAHVIALRGWDGSPTGHSYLAHEAFHAAEQVLETRGMRLTGDTSEAYAYLIESIVRRCMEIIGSVKPNRRR